MKLNIISKRKWFLSLSALFVTLSLISIVLFGFMPGIDFKSGSMWQVKIKGADERIVREFAEKELGFSSPIVSYDSGTESYSLIFEEISGEKHEEIKDLLTARFPESEELDFGTTSPSVSSELRDKALWIIIVVVAIITLYVTFTFRKVSWPVKSWKYGLVTLVSLLHDIIIAAGFFAAVGYFKGITVDTYFIVALLTVAGFSVQDTIVIFDRIRENLLGNKDKADFNEIANKSVNEVFVRSLNTATGAMIALLIVAILGPVSMRYFALTMLVGMFFGTYSSIFVASPLLTLWYDLASRKEGKKIHK